MNISEFVLRKMDEKEKTKKSVYEGINMSRQTFDNRLESGKFFIDEFLDIAKFLDIDPSEVWEEWKESNLLNNNMGTSNRITMKKNSAKLGDHNFSELIRQNGVLIDLIDRLTKGGN